MTISAFGRTLGTLSEGVSAFIEDEARPMPLTATAISVTAAPGLATIVFTRIFENRSDQPIEAIFTMPSAFDSVLTGLAATIDGRRLQAVAKSQDDARSDYEDAVSEGRLAVLHEEPMRGIHMLSVGPIAPGKRVGIESTLVQPLVVQGTLPFLRVPLTVGDIYGSSPFIPVDDLIVDPSLSMSGRLSVKCGEARAFLDGALLDGDITIPLNRSIELRFEGLGFGIVKGTDAKGRDVTLTFDPDIVADAPLDVSILIDRSGSTGSAIGRRGRTVLSTIQEAVLTICSTLSETDRVSIWEFDNSATMLADGFGNPFAGHSITFGQSRGGTELGNAVLTVMAHRKAPLLVLTDGQTHASEVQAIAAYGLPVHAVLVGEDSLDATIGHLAAMTGGQVLVAQNDDASSAALRAISALRQGTAASSATIDDDGLPRTLTTIRGGVRIHAEWGTGESARTVDGIGALAAALALPHMDEARAGTFAAAHGLATHLTSLVLVDHDSSERVTGLPRTEKVPLPGRTSGDLSILYDATSVTSRDFFAYSEELPSRPSVKSVSARMQSVDRYNLPGRGLPTDGISLPLGQWPMLTGLLQTINLALLPEWLRDWIVQHRNDPQVLDLSRAITVSPEQAALFIRAALDQAHDRSAERLFRGLGRIHGPAALRLAERLASQV